MQTVLTAEQLKDWAWAWARRLHEDITLTNEWFSEIASLYSGLEPEQAMRYQTALSLATTAYFENLKGRWTRQRAQEQIAEAEKILPRGK